MDCSSDESSELSETDIDDYADKSYFDLKSGKFVARLGSDRFRCPFCPGKKKQDYRYKELLQHAVGVGTFNRAAKVKGGAILMKQLVDFKPIQITAVYGANEYAGYVIVLFTKDWIGFQNALAFHNYFRSQRLGKLEWETKQHVKYVFGWLAKEEDYKSDGPVGRFLSANGDLKIVSELEPEMSRLTIS